MKTRNTQPTGSIVSIYGFADGSSTTSNYTSITPMIGVYGRASQDAAEMKINHFGLLAQDVQEIFPNLVYESGDGYLSINYVELIPILIKSVQELSSEVAELTAQLNELQTQKK